MDKIIVHNPVMKIKKDKKKKKGIQFLKLKDENSRRRLPQREQGRQFEAGYKITRSENKLKEI